MTTKQPTFRRQLERSYLVLTLDRHIMKSGSLVLRVDQPFSELVDQIGVGPRYAEIRGSWQLLAAPFQRRCCFGSLAFGEQDSRFCQGDLVRHRQSFVRDLAQESARAGRVPCVNREKISSLGQKAGLRSSSEEGPMRQGLFQMPARGDLMTFI